MDSDRGRMQLKPLVTVIMPVHNEGQFIERSLGSILRQTYPKDRIEIIVADGMSQDNTRFLINKTAAKSKIRVTIVDNPKRIAPAALNAALNKAKGDIIVRVDGHCEIGSDYISNCVDLLQSGRADGVGGPIETIGKDTRSTAIALAMSSKFGVGGSAFRTINDREMYTDTVAFPGYSKEIMDRAGLFNEELVRNQDDEYNYRIRKLGGRILLSPRLRSRYYSRSTFKSLWSQYFQYGYWKVRVFQLHPRQMSVRQFAPLVFLLSIFALALLAAYSEYGRWGLFSLLALYLVTNLTAGLLASRRDLTLLPYVCISFWILHFSYGLGFLLGLVFDANLVNRTRWQVFL